MSRKSELVVGERNSDVPEFRIDSLVGRCTSMLDTGFTRPLLKARMPTMIGLPHDQGSCTGHRHR
jgi:hypothetical protein